MLDHLQAVVLNEKIYTLYTKKKLLAFFFLLYIKNVSINWYVLLFFST